MNIELERKIKAMVIDQMHYFRQIRDEYGECIVTVGTDFKNIGWQTGDNSYSGAAYSYPHWAVSYVVDRMTMRTLIEEIVDQLDEIESQLNPETIALYGGDIG